MADQEQITLTVDERPAITAIDRANKALESHETKSQTSADVIARHWNQYGETVVRVSDKSKSSIDRLVASMQKQAELAGKSGVERMVAERDQLIRRYEGEQRAVDAISKSYERLIAVEMKESEAKAAASKMASLGQASSYLTNAVPMGGSFGAIPGMMAGLGTTGAALGGIAAGLTAIAVAGYESAKSLGEFSIRLHDTELRTGFTAREVGEFGFAAKAVGQDVSVFERMMRGLANAVEDESAAGEKGRKWLVQFGVDVAGVKSGAVSTSQVIEQVAEGMTKLPTAIERDKAALDIFKRAGIELIPVLMSLKESLRIAREEGFGNFEASAEGLKKCQQEVAILQTKWEYLKLSMEKKIVATIEFVVKGAPVFNRVSAAVGTMGLSELVNGPEGAALGTILHPATMQTPMSVPSAPWNLLEQQRKQVGDEAERLRNLYFGGHDALERAYQKAKKDVETYQEALKPENVQREGLGMADVQATGLKLKTAVDAEARAKAAIDAAQKAKGEATRYESEAQAFIERGAEIGITEMGKIYAARDRILAQLEKLKKSESELAAIRASAEQQIAPLMEKAEKELDSYMRKQEEAKSKKYLLAAAPISTEDLKRTLDQFKAQEEIASIAVEAQKTELRRQAGAAGRMVEGQTGGTEGKSPESMLSAARSAYAIRIDLANQLARIEIDRISKEEDGAHRAVLAANAQKDLYLAMNEAQDQFAQKQEEIQRKILEDQRKGLAETERTVESLMHTLFMDPHKFGEQFKRTIHEALLKPVIEGSSGMIAGVIDPLIHGMDGRGGLAGVFKGAFGGKQDPVKVTIDNNTGATISAGCKIDQ